jgi:GLPGLI family protein
MKNVFLGLLSATFCVALSHAQLKEGKVTFKMDASTDNPNMQMAVTMLQGSTLDILFKGQATRSVMKMGTMMNVVTVTNSESGKVVMLMDGMVGKNGVLTSLEELKALTPEQPENKLELQDEVKTIEGFLCKKAVLTDAEGNESTFWYTEEIAVSKEGQSYLNNQVPGFPLEYEINANGLKMTLTATSVAKKLEKKSDALFQTAIPDGYKVMTLAEMSSMGM